MSSGSNNSASDRHLKKIYDCLNIGSNKKAVQKIDSLPKDVKDLTVYKTLKALALIRMAKRRQAFDILDEINLEEDLDELTLQTMTSCYKESVNVGKIVDLYEAAAARKPDDPEIMAHLFMAHVRAFNFKRQKEIALQMYKSFSNKKRLYFFWAIMSLVMQSHEVEDFYQQGCDENPDKKVCLSLAERMCEKMIEEERTHEEIELFLMILKKQHKHEEEYRFLTGQFCLRITDHLSWFNRRRAYLCLDLKMYSRAFKHYFPTLIQEYPDQIEYYQGLFKSAYLLDTEAPSQQQPVAINDQQSSGATQTTGTPVKTTSALAECYDIVEKQCQLSIEGGDSAKDQSSSKSKGCQAGSKNLSRTSSLNPNRKRLLRGPYIARIELYHTILSNESALPKSVYNQCLAQFSTKFSNLPALLVDFFQAFSKKVICYYDLAYLFDKCKPTAEETSEFLQTIKTWVNELPQSNPEMREVHIFHSKLVYHMLRHAFHNYTWNDSLEDRLNKAKEFIDLYDANRKICGRSCKTEFLYVDHYALLAVNAVMTHAINAELVLGDKPILTDNTLASLMVVAENAVAESPTNHQIKLLLLKLYSFVGASKVSSDILLTLDIKHFQIDTLGHLLNPVLYNVGNYTLTRESLETCLEFYAHGIRECFEGLTTCYRDGRFSKVEEISVVLRRLCDSLNAAQCVLLRGVVSILNAATIEDLIASSQSFDPFQGLYRIFRCPDATEKIKDSRDVHVLKSLHFGVHDLVDERKMRSLADEELWLRLRYYLVRSAYLQVDQFTMSNTTSSKKRARLEALKEIEYGLREVESLMPKIEERRTIGAEDNRYTYLEPEVSPFRWLSTLWEPLIDMVKPLVFCTDIFSLTEDVYNRYLHNFEILSSAIDARLLNIETLIDVKKSLMTLTIGVEFLSLCVTSLVSLSHIEHTKTTQQLSGKVLPNSSQQIANPKGKSVVQRMINKTEALLTKISSAIKVVDLKPLVDRISLHDCLLADPNNPLPSLMHKTSSQANLLKVKDGIMDSYMDALKEIDATCKRKAKLLRAKA